MGHESLNATHMVWSSLEFRGADSLLGSGATIEILKRLKDSTLHYDTPK